MAVRSRGLSVRAPHACRIRRPVGGKNQRCCRADEFHAQHWAERRDIRCYHPDCSTQSVSSICLGKLHSFWPVSRFYHRSCNSADALRPEHACCSTTGTRPAVRYGSCPSCSPILRRCLLAAVCDLGDYVSRLILPEEK